jgi:hypothetical protein
LQLFTFLEESGSIGADARDKPSAQRLVGVHASRRQRELAHQRVIPCGV